MDTWIEAQTKIDQGIRLLGVANKLIQDGREMMEKVNEPNKVEKSKVSGLGKGARLHHVRITG